MMSTVKKARTEFFILPLLLLLYSCEDDIPAPSRALGFPPLVYQFESVPADSKIIELGAHLFYDPILSLDSTVSCSSCHAQEHGFASHNDQFSRGVNGTLGTRNSPPLANLIFYPYFSWDGGINHLEIQPITPITDTLEMHEKLLNVIRKLQDSQRYQKLFTRAFKTDSITDKQLLIALTQYMGILISDESKFDDFIKGKAQLSNEEEKGYQLFKMHCEGCHSGLLFTNFDFKNNGLVEKKESDLGRFRITQMSEDKWKFRVPSLRNVSVTYPYLHDGSVSNLDSIVALYAQPNFGGDISSEGITIDKTEQKAIVSFLKTLTDYHFLSNPEYLPNPDLYE